VNSFIRRMSMVAGLGCLVGGVTLDAEEAAAVPRVPVLVGEWWRICEMPELGELAGPVARKQNVVDHGFVQDAEGTWHLWACIRGTAVSRLIYGWRGKSLEEGPWEPAGVKVRAREEYGEQIKNGNETAGAPYFFRKDGAWWCLFHSGGMRLMKSENGADYERVKMDDGSWKTGIPGGRDVHVMKHGDTWYSYATVTEALPGKPPTRENLTSWVVAATSKDFERWGNETVVSKGGKPGDGPVDAESPFVLELDGFFYLFRASSITFKTYVYRSKDPLDFGIDDDSKLIAEFPIKAPELIHHEGQWYISDLHDFQGIRLSKLEWREDG